MPTTLLSILSAHSETLCKVSELISATNVKEGYRGNKNIELKEFILGADHVKHIVFLKPSKNFMTVSSPNNLRKLGDVEVVILGVELPKDLIGFLQDSHISGFINPDQIDEPTFQKLIGDIEQKGYFANEHIPFEYWVNKSPHSFPRPKPALTAGEERVLQLLCHNFSVKEICIKLEKNEPAIRAHITNIREKLGAKSLLEMVVITMANMWIVIDPSLTSSKSPFL
jgi:DNA-binding CsgD family transcriptional regulator